MCVDVNASRVAKLTTSQDDLLSVVAMSFLLRETGLRRTSKSCLAMDIVDGSEKPAPPKLEYLTGGAKLLGFGVM